MGSIDIELFLKSESPSAEKSQIFTFGLLSADGLSLLRNCSTAQPDNQQREPKTVLGN